MSIAVSSSCGKQCSLRKRRRYRELSSISLRLAKKDLLKASNVVEGVELEDDIDLIEGDIGKVGSRLHRTSARYQRAGDTIADALIDPEERLVYGKSEPQKQSSTSTFDVLEKFCRS
ncbi:hypothetical protein RvY_03116-3 [Ramazzottius varieornatus]|uniref:Uncharacterized protein n=1 Tax=Ramazzottius varieornatus TaxID=947166 RepID=A0A1D1UQE5_RAMVA|nr:hypothetical protein RvY_03116-3 [Ramazzottius varieornatus]